MKYMKLGSKPDIFQTSNGVVTVFSELASDITFEVEGALLRLHKFPLLSKCSRLQKIVGDEAMEAVVHIDSIPGGFKAFDFCAKFCYGISITLNAYNVMIVRCAAEYLGMTENVEKGNLIFKLEVFLSSSIFKGWKDSIIALKTAKSLLPWSQELQIISRCIDSIASKTSVSPSKVDWSYTHTRKSSRRNGITSDTSPSQSVSESNHQSQRSNVPKDWWIEDICELDIDFFLKVIAAIKAKGRMSHKLIGEALCIYAYRWLPGVSKESTAVLGSDGKKTKSPSTQLVESSSAKHKLLLETIVSLLPNEKGTCSCSFLSRLLKAAMVLGVEDSVKLDLAKRIGLQLDEASLNDVLIPSLSYANDSLYDVDLVQRFVDDFFSQGQSPSSSPVGHRQQQVYEKRRSLSADHLDYLVRHANEASTASDTSKVKVAKLIDAYLAEIAKDSNLSLTKFIDLADSIPEFARPVHDGLYRAVDIFLKEHPDLTKSERKSLCRLMDCKKLSMHASMHAAQNERLPLRVVVQVLFFEQVRSATAGGLLISELPNNVKALLRQTESSSEEHNDDENVVQRSAHIQEEEWDSVHNGSTADKRSGLVNINQMGTIHSKSTRNSMPEHEVFALRQYKARNILSNSKRMLTRLLSVKHGSSAGSVKGSEISKSSGSSVSSVPSKVDAEHSTSAAAPKDIIRRSRNSVS